MLILENFQKQLNLPSSFINEAVFSDTVTQEDIIKAINTRQYLGIYYEPEDGDSGFRLIEPYCLGKGYKVGGKISNPDKLYLRAFVIRDTAKDDKLSGFKFKDSRKKSKSATKKDPYWRTFLVDKISSVVQTGRTFSYYREGYKPNDSHFVEILGALEHGDFPRGSRPL